MLSLLVFPMLDLMLVSPWLPTRSSRSESVLRKSLLLDRATVVAMSLAASIRLSWMKPGLSLMASPTSLAD